MVVINFFVPGEDEPVEVEWPTGWPLPSVDDAVELDRHEVFGRVKEINWCNEKPPEGKLGTMWSIDITLR